MQGWKFLAGDENLTTTDDYILISSNDSSVFIDISWTPEGNPDGHWTCRILHPDRDKFPVKFLETEDRQIALDWLKEYVCVLPKKDLDS